MVTVVTMVLMVMKVTVVLMVMMVAVVMGLPPPPEIVSFLRVILRHSETVLRS